MNNYSKGKSIQHTSNRENHVVQHLQAQLSQWNKKVDQSCGVFCAKIDKITSPMYNKVAVKQIPVGFALGLTKTYERTDNC